MLYACSVGQSSNQVSILTGCHLKYINQMINLEFNHEVHLIIVKRPLPSWR